MSKTYACWRVSSNEQNEARQLAAFQNCGEEIDEIFGDKMSGKSMDRPEYQRMVEKLEPGDLVIFSSLDRMSRSYDDTAKAWDYITKEKGADILILDMVELLDTRKGKDLVGTLISDIVVKLLSYVAQTERENIKKRQTEGIAAMPVDENGKKISKKTGRGFGRQEKRPDNFADVYARQQAGELTLMEALAEAGVGRTRWYELAREMAG
jgi:DNA invertase Pin-like site-specific DNA recombinase